MTDEPRWTSPSDIANKLMRLWERGTLLAARFGTEAPLFPYAMSLRRPDARELGTRFADAQRWVQALEDGSRTKRGFGYDIEWEDIRHRQLGRNTIPKAIVIRAEEDALRLIGKHRDADRFSRLTEKSLQVLPELRDWLTKRPLTALSHEADWEHVLAVLSWFREHPRPGIYLRQLDVAGVDTKFIEAHRSLLSELLDIVLPPEAIDAQAQGARQFEARYGALAKPPLIRFRLLDPELHLGPLSDIATLPAQFARLDLPVERVFITENEINGLAFPDTAKSLVLFGLGYGLDRLADIAWLRDKRVYYWGDIDTHGFSMLDRLRAKLPQAESFLMDRETLMQHQSHWSHESGQHDAVLARLTRAENALYDVLRSNQLGKGVRLEQERIGYGWLEQALASQTVLGRRA